MTVSELKQYLEALPDDIVISVMYGEEILNINRLKAIETESDTSVVLFHENSSFTEYPGISMCEINKIEVCKAKFLYNKNGKNNGTKI